MIWTPLGNSCQFGSLVSPGHIHSFGVLKSLHQNPPKKGHIDWEMGREEVYLTRFANWESHLTELENMQELLQFRIPKKECLLCDQFSYNPK